MHRRDWPTLKSTGGARKVKVKFSICDNCNKKPSMMNIEMQARKLKPIYMATKPLQLCLKCHEEMTEKLKNTSGFVNGN